MVEKYKKWMFRFDSLSLRTKLNILRGGILVPLFVIIVWLIFLSIDINEQYSRIINNVAAATEFNSEFRKDMDYNMYRIVAGAADFDNTPVYQDINQARGSLNNLKVSATTEISVDRIEAILRLVDGLEKYVRCIETKDLPKERKDWFAVLEWDIYIYTELIDERLADYIRYEAATAKTLKTNLESQIMQMLSYSLMISILLVVIVLGFTNRISKSIEIPIKELCDSTKEVAQGNFSIRVKPNQMEEIQVLSNSFNYMVKKIGSLIDDVKVEQIQYRKSELKLLQSQINPHFLYNTLDTIVWMAEDGQCRQVVEMVNRLSTFFRTTLSKGKDFIAVNEEESHIRSYLEIQQFRYRDIMEYEIKIDKSIYIYYILKMSLQPLVENAIYHGIKNKRGKGKVMVRGYFREGSLWFEVEDTGLGMKPEELQELLKHIEGDTMNDESGFGLKNVNERLRLNYGPDSKLRIESEYGIGTKMYFKIPASQKDTL